MIGGIRKSAPAAITIAAALLVSIAATPTGYENIPHDFNLDLADVALEKAQGLLLLTSCTVANEKSTKECEKAVAKALEDVADARSAIANAKAASDAATGQDTP
jgi:hypothetical protein